MELANPSLIGGEASSEWSLGPFQLVHYRWSRSRLRLTRLGREILQLSAWLEMELFPEASRHGEIEVVATLDAEGAAEYRAGRRRLAAREIGSYPQLFTFLAALGIRRLVLDPRLESNQVSDLLFLLFASRRTLLPGLRRPSARGLVAVLFGKDGLQFSCARTRVDGDRLRVAYSYCTTRFSRVVHWFTRRNRHFNDHRALFVAAPRFGLIAATIALVGPLVLILGGHMVLILAVTVLAAAAIFVLVYLFFMTVGSLEYDNEEKAFRLAQAYREVNRYAERVQIDLRRAQAVQEKIIPKVEEMPFAEHLEWAASFVPQSEVGGDYFDVGTVDERRLALLFSDVSGHGLAAAMITALLKISFETWLAEGWSLSEFARRLNRQLCALTPDESFAAAFVGVYDVVSGELNYVNCGHSPAPRRVSRDGSVPVSPLGDGQKILLGVMDHCDFEPASTRLIPGETLVFVTDGISETEGYAEEHYGQRRMDELLAANRGAAPSEMIRRLMEDLSGFSRGEAQDDDLTVLAMRIR